MAASLAKSSVPPRPLDPYLDKLWAWIRRNWRTDASVRRMLQFLGREDPAAGVRRTLRFADEIEQVRKRMQSRKTK